MVDGGNIIHKSFSIYNFVKNVNITLLIYINHMKRHVVLVTYNCIIYIIKFIYVKMLRLMYIFFFFIININAKKFLLYSRYLIITTQLTILIM